MARCAANLAEQSFSVVRRLLHFRIVWLDSLGSGQRGLEKRGSGYIGTSELIHYAISIGIGADSEALGG